MRIAWESQGAGAPLLLVQGLGYTRAGWGPARDRLAQRYRVVSYDNRGIGESDVPPGPYTVEQMAGDALQVLDEAGIERAHVVSASLGGMIAQHLAAHHPERVDRLVLACTHPGVEDGHPMPQVTVDLFAQAPMMEPQVALRRFVDNSLGASPPPGLADEVYAYRLANPPDMNGWLSQAAAGTTFEGVDLARIEAPTLVVTGTHDNVIDCRNSELLADRIPDARLERLEGAGHLFFWERSDDFVRLVEEFLG
jgi:pimeloyl-ACP methyl ester carboxylesterase